MDDELKIVKQKRFGHKRFGFYYLDTLTSENETIKGGSLYLFGKRCFTVAISNEAWIKENGEPYRFGIKNSVLYIRKFSIGFGNR